MRNFFGHYEKSTKCYWGGGRVFMEVSRKNVSLINPGPLLTIRNWTVGATGIGKRYFGPLFYHIDQCSSLGGGQGSDFYGAFLRK